MRGCLHELGFELGMLSDGTAKPIEKIANIKKAMDCICLNETSRSKFDVMAREIFRKYHALYPEVEVKPFIREFNAIDTIYGQLNQQTKSADVTFIMMELQQLVNESVAVVTPDRIEEGDGVYIDLSKLDFDKLKAAFAKVPRKNALVYDLQKANEKNWNK